MGRRGNRGLGLRYGWASMGPGLMSYNVHIEPRVIQVLERDVSISKIPGGITKIHFQTEQARCDKERHRLGKM